MLMFRVIIVFCFQLLLIQPRVVDTGNCRHGDEGQRTIPVSTKVTKVMSTTAAATVTAMMKLRWEKMDAGQIHCLIRKLTVL